MQCKSDGKIDSITSKNILSPSPIVVEIENVKPSESAENFQKFMYELFEKNGVIHDLRAYLRGHIVGVLRSAQTGDTPSCQKHFTQRLELPIQALNILIAEYLLRLEFSYSLSVFVSEIPLANMVFAFAKSLMQNTNCDADLRFKDKDVWSILNCLGVKCDSDQAANVVDMYRRDKHTPLLLCMLKCMSMCTEPAGFHRASSQESISSSDKSVRSLNITYSHSPTTSNNKCKHSAFCKTCQSKMLDVKQKYNRKKKALVKILKDSHLRQHNVDFLMTNIDVLERNLLDEMFQEMKSVYEGEMQMVKNEEQKRLKSAVATHAVKFEKKRVEMEEQFKEREAELERNVLQKKRFLWGLARLLRDQHSHMSRAMRDVQAETGRLSDKENSLKTQLAEAEKVLRQRGEDMRDQISQELVILEAHLESMKKERDSINKERSELESIRNVSSTNGVESNRDEIRSHYALLKTEFSILKKYLETAKVEPKCVLDRSTMTEVEDTFRMDVLNNENDEKTSNEGRLKVKRVMNDLKKPKNVNFSQIVVSSNLDEVYRSQSRSSRSTASSAGTAGPDRSDRDLLRDLTDENRRLRTFARQQGSHIESLSTQQARLQAELTAMRSPLTATPLVRPRTAPSTIYYDGRSMFTQRLNSSVTNLSNGWRKGAGEELSFLSNAQPRIVVPGDTVPFIGVVRDRHNDNRRYLINQWRSLRRCASPLGGVGKRTRDRPSSAGPSIRLLPREDLNEDQNATKDDDIGSLRENYERVMISEANPRDVKISKSVLKESKEKPKTKVYNTPTPIVREKSPNTILRDAKLRLRKLEIEAEAVEQSYLDFRRRREATREEGRVPTDKDVTYSKHIDTLNRLTANEDASRKNQSTSHYNRPQTTTITDFDKYIKEYHAKYDIGETYFKNKNTTSRKAKPVPNFADYEIPSKEDKLDYLETPIVEFRKYYHSEKRVVYEKQEDKTPVNIETVESVSKHKNPGSKDSKNNPKSQTKKINSSENINQDQGQKSPKTDKSGSIHSKIRPKSPKIKKVDPETSDTVPVSPRSNTIRNDPNSSKLNSEELEINESENKQEKQVKDNINKTYKLDETIIADNNFNDPLNVELLMNNENKEKTEISKDNGDTKEPIEDRNILRIELDSVAQVNDVKITESLTQDLLLLVESSANEKNPNIDFNQDTPQMTFLVSPKRSNIENDPNSTSPAKSRNSELGEKSVKIDNDILNSIYEADPNDNASSVRIMQLGQSKDTLENTMSELEAIEDPDYPDDFSADVDNFNTVDSDFGNRSPISMPNTTSENDNFWD